MLLFAQSRSVLAAAIRDGGDHPAITQNRFCFRVKAEAPRSRGTTPLGGTGGGGDARQPGSWDLRSVSDDQAQVTTLAGRRFPK
jgi:hypothetical protein